MPSGFSKGAIMAAFIVELSAVTSHTFQMQASSEDEAKALAIASMDAQYGPDWSLAGATAKQTPDGES
jgi:hypothetical protein